MLPLSQAQPPSWVYPGAKFDLDFRNNRYWGGYVSQKGTAADKGEVISASGAYTTASYTPTRNGVLAIGTSLGGQNRITDLGLFIERAATNRALWCRDLTNAAWTASSVTVAKTQAGADGVVNAASTLTASGANGTVLQVITLASGSRVFSAYVKRLVGSGTLSMTMDGGSTYTDVTSQVSSTGYSWVQIAPQTVTNPSVGFKIGTSADSFAVDFCQLETGPLATTPLITTSATNARFNEADTCGSSPTANNGQRFVNDVFGSGGPYAVLMSFNGDVSTTVPNGPAIVASDLTLGTINGGGGCALHNTVNIGNNGRNNWNKGCVRINGLGRTCCLNGGAVSANTAGATNLPFLNSAGTHVNFGNNGSGTGDLPLNGSIGRITLWDREITDGQMVEFTTLVNGV